MNLKDIIKVDFEFVKKQYILDHGIKNDKWETGNLERANRKFGNWISAKIFILEIGEIVLPHYKHGGASIVSEEGSLLKDAYDHFKKNRKTFEKTNSQFCERVEFQKKRILEEGVKSIFLSQEPLLSGLSYSGLKKFKDRITHLDGFHRLMGLMEIEKKPEFIQSYIAVYHNL